MVVFALLTPGSGAWVIVIALVLAGLGMGTAMPSTSSVMANEVKVSEFGVMSAAQLLAMQVGEVAGIQVLETVQQSLARRRGLSHAHPGLPCCQRFTRPLSLARASAAFGLVAATFIRSIPRLRTRRVERLPVVCRPMSVEVMAGSESYSHAGSSSGVLVLHGFTGNPASMRSIAENAAAAGYSVSLPRLPGHGTSVEDMMTTTWADWSKAAEAAYDELALTCSRIAVVGLSMGGGLAAYIGEVRPTVGIVFIILS